MESLSFDGSFDYSQNAAGVGGIVRDFKDNLILAFTNSMVAHQTMEAELQALIQGLQLILSHPIQSEAIIFRGDAFNVISGYKENDKLG